MGTVPQYLMLDNYMAEKNKDPLQVEQYLNGGSASAADQAAINRAVAEANAVPIDPSKALMGLSDTPVPGIAPPQSPADFMKFMVPTPEERALKNKYSTKTEEALSQQASGINKLDQLMTDLKGTGTSLDLSPLAAYIDSTVPGSKLTGVAQEQAKFSPQAKRDQIISLQEKIQNATKGVSDEYLKNLGEQLKGLQSNRLALGTAASLAKSQSFMDRVDVTKDTQAKAEEKNWDEDKVNMPRIKQLQQIGLDRHTLKAGGVINDTIMNEIASGIGSALAGGKAAGLGQAERNDIESYAKKWAKLKGEVQDKQFNALSEDNRKFMMDLFDRLEGGFVKMVQARAREKSKGAALYPHNPEAARVHRDKANYYMNYKIDRDAPETAAPPTGDLHDNMSTEELQKYIQDNS